MHLWCTEHMKLHGNSSAHRNVWKRILISWTAGFLQLCIAKDSVLFGYHVLNNFRMFFT